VRSRLCRTLGVAIVGTLFSAQSAVAQESTSGSWFVRGALTEPRILPSSPFEPNLTNHGSPPNWVPNLTVEVGRQTNGTQEWHHLYGLPSYGVGFSVAHFQNGAEHGQPLEAYAFFSWPLFRISERLDTTTDFGMGLSWNWRPISAEQQATDPVLGSDLNARINWGVYLRYAASPRMSLYTGLDFTHRSNGGLVQPDLGINVLGPKVALQYNFSPGVSSQPTLHPRPFQPSWELLVGGAGGLKNVVQRATPISREDFGVFHATAAVQQRFYRFGNITFGTDLTFDGAADARSEMVDGTLTFSHAARGGRWEAGAYGGYEHLIGRFGAFVDVGYTVARINAGDTRFPRFYQRFGWRYRINDRLWSTIAVRSIDGHKADFAEVGLGYRVRLSGSDLSAEALRAKADARDR
jgi:hypothetical protein